MFYKVLIQNGVHGVPDGISIIEKLGLRDKLIDEYGQINTNAQELREVNKFLNRILSLESTSARIKSCRLTDGRMYQIKKKSFYTRKFHSVTAE